MIASQKDGRLDEFFLFFFLRSSVDRAIRFSIRFHRMIYCELSVEIGSCWLFVVSGFLRKKNFDLRQSFFLNLYPVFFFHFYLMLKDFTNR